MCGRYTLRRTAEEVAEAFGAAPADDLEWSGPRYNIAPTQEALFVRSAEEGGRQLAGGRWGLVPFWVDDPDDFPTLINARAETVHEKPMFEDAFERFAVTGTPVEVERLPHLTPSEQQLFQYLTAENLRLEQERIPHAYVTQYLDGLDG